MHAVRDNNANTKVKLYFQIELLGTYGWNTEMEKLKKLNAAVTRLNRKSDEKFDEKFSKNCL